MKQLQMNKNRKNQYLKNLIRAFLCGELIALPFACSKVFGKQLFLWHEADWMNLSLWGGAFLKSIPIAAACMVIMCAWERIWGFLDLKFLAQSPVNAFKDTRNKEKPNEQEKLNEQKKNKKVAGTDSQNESKNQTSAKLSGSEKLKLIWGKIQSIQHKRVIVWLLTFLCWVPALLATFPGIYAYDARWQVQWFRTGSISAFHPVLHTYILGGCITLGNKLFGSYNIGMLLYSLLQMIFLSGVMAYLAKRLSHKLPRVILVVMILLNALLPYNALFSFSATKDIYFAGFVVLFFLELWAMAENQAAYLADKKNWIRFVLCMFFVCAFRNNGYYAFLFTIPFALIVCRKEWKRAVLLLVAALVLWNVYTGPVYSLLGIQGGDVREALSVPMQQLSRTLLENPQEISEEDQKLIAEYIPDWEKYAPRVADTVKDHFNSAKVEADSAAFIKLWIRVGKSCPISYMNAFADMNLGFWYTGMEYPDEVAYVAYMEYDNHEGEGYVKIDRTCYLPKVGAFYERFAKEASFKDVKGMSWLCTPASAFWLILWTICYAIYKRRYYLAMPLALLVGIWGTLLLSPVVFFRYAYGLMLCAPVLVAMCGECKKIEV